MKDTLKFKMKILPSGAWEVSKQVRELVNKNFKEDEIAVWVDIEFKKIKKKRSYDLLKYYWAVVIPLVLCGIIDQGNDDLSLDDKDDRSRIHDLMKKMFLNNSKDIQIGDELLEIPSSTSLCDNKEFIIYLKKIAVWASEFLGIEIPVPKGKIQADDGIIISVEEYLQKKRIEFMKRA